MQTFRTTFIVAMCAAVTACVAPRRTLAQTPAALMPAPNQVFVDQNGSPVVFGKVCFYQSGTNTPQSTYTDSTGSVLATNPVILDSGGRASIWLNSNAYRVQLRTAGTDNTCSTGVILWTKDGVTSFTNAGLTGSVVIGSGNSLTMQAGSTSNLAASLMPSVNGTYDVGSAVLQWRTLYSVNATINRITAGSVSAGGQVSAGSLNTTGATTGFQIFSGLPSTDLSFITTGGVGANGPLVSMSATTNASYGWLEAYPGLYVSLISGRSSGSGTYLPLNFFTNNTEAMRIDTSQRVLVGLTSTDITAPLVVNGALTATTAALNSSLLSLSAVAGTYTAIASNRSGSGTFLPMAFFTNATEAARFDLNQTLILHGKVSYNTTAFASLGAAPAAGTAIYCTDCTTAATCAGAGSGHLAISNGSAWSCQ